MSGQHLALVALGLCLSGRMLLYYKQDLVITGNPGTWQGRLFLCFKLGVGSSSLTRDFHIFKDNSMEIQDIKSAFEFEKEKHVEFSSVVWKKILRVTFLYEVHC